MTKQNKRTVTSQICIDGKTHRISHVIHPNNEILHMCKKCGWVFGV